MRGDRKTLRRFDRSRRRSIFVPRRGWRRHLGTVGLVVGFAVAGAALVDIVADIASDVASLDHGAEHDDAVEDHTDLPRDDVVALELPELGPSRMVARGRVRPGVVLHHR